jgi:hypothetical protein
MNHVAIKGPSALQVLQQGLTHGFVHVECLGGGRAEQRFLVQVSEVLTAN